MTEQAKKYLSDIFQAILLIEDFTLEIKSFEDYTADLKTQSAVERQLGIIGEAVNKFDRLNTGISFENAKQIVGFRNRLIHSYDAVDPAIVWAIIKNHLLPLKNDAEDYLKTN